MIFSSLNVRAMDPFIINVNSVDYPQLESQMFFFDDSGKPVFAEQSEVKLEENGKSIEEFLLSCPIDPAPQATHYVIAVDVSESMDVERVTLAEQALVQFANNIDFTKDFATLIYFTDRSVVALSKSQDKDAFLLKSFITVSRQPTNLDSALLQENAIIDIAVSGGDNPVIVLITDGEGDFNTEKVSTKLGDIPLYSILLGSDYNRDLQDLSGGLAALSFADILDFPYLINSVRAVVAHAAGYQPCRVNWSSQSCDTLNEVTVQWREASHEYTFRINPTDLDEIKYFNTNQIEFGNVGIGEHFRSISIGTNNGDLSISKIRSNNPKFEVVTSMPMKVTPFSSPVVTVKYTATDNLYEVAEFTIEYNECNSSKFYASAGKKISGSDGELEIISPNGGEVFYINDIIEIKWRGVSPRDTVTLEYSADKGENWYIITDNATSLSYKWILPESVSDQYLLRVKLLSDSELDERIQRFPLAQSDPIKIIWNDNDSKLMVLYEDAYLEAFDLSKNEVTYSLELPAQKLFAGAWSHTDLTKMVYVDEKKNDIVLFSLENGFISKKISTKGKFIRQLEFHPTLDILAGSTEDGNILFWHELETEFSDLLDSEVDADTLINHFSFNSDGSKIALTNATSIVHVFNFYTKERLDRFIYSTHELYKSEFSATSSSIAIARNDNSIITRLLQGTSNLFTLDFGSRYINHEFNRSTGELIYLSNSKEIKMADPVTGAFLRLYSEQSEPIMFSVAKQKDLIASIGKNNELHIWSSSDIPFENITIDEDVSDAAWSVIEFNLEIKELDFGSQIVGRSKDTTVKAFLHNPMSIPINIDTLVFNSEFFSISGIQSVIFPGESVDAHFSFTPKLPLEYESKVYLFSGINRIVKSIKGRGIEMPLAINEIEDFGMVKTGMTVSSFIQFKNNSNSDIILTNARFIPQNTDFSLLADEIILTKNSNQEVEILFNPQNVGFQQANLIWDFTFAGVELEASIILEGNGISGILLVKDTNLGDFSCGELPVGVSVEISNTGKDELRIYDAIMDNDSYDVVSSFPIVIKPSSQDSINITFNPDASGSFPAQLTISTDEYRREEVSVQIEASYAGANFYLDRDTLFFSGLVPQEQELSQFSIINSGDEDITFDLPVDIDKFTISSIEPTVVAPDVEATVTVKFIGASELGEYLSEYTFEDQCGNKRKIVFLAKVSENYAKYEAASELNFGKVKCSNFDTLTYEISNYGSSELEIYSANSNRAEFSIAMAQKVIIGAGETKSLYVIFNSSIPGTFSAKFDIVTNATNLQNGIFQLDVSAERIINEYSLSTSEIDFGRVLINQSEIRIFTINNTANSDLDIDLTSDNPLFSISSNKVIIPAGGQEEIEIELNANTQTGELIGTLTISDDCQETNSIRLLATADEYAQAGLRIGSAEAHTGDTVRIPIYLYSPEEIDLPNVNGYTITLELDKTILFPIGNTPIGELNGHKRKIILVNLSPTPDANEVIGEITFIATLGSTLQTSIEMIEAEAIADEDITIEYNDGFFALLEKDSTDLIKDTGIFRLHVPVPNPSSSETIIKYELIENASILLNLYDNLGRQVKTLINGEATRGEYEIRFRSDAYASGIYYLRLQSNDLIDTQKLIIAK